MLPNIRDYDQLYREFRWPQLARYNIGVDVCDKWAARDPDRLAILNIRADGKTENISFGWLRETSNRLANTLAAHGVARGDRVAMLLPQTPEAAVGHIAIYKLGAVAVPLAILFGVDALSYRLQNAGVKAVITNAQGLAKLNQIRGELPELVRALDRRPRRRRARLLRDDRARVRRFHAGRHDARRSGADDLHLRHHRPGQGRAARASRAARPFARRRDAARVFPAAGRPVLDAGRLGLGRRPARLPAAEPASRRAGGGAPVREVRSRGGLRAAGEGAGAQRLHPADRAAHAALRALAEGPPRHPPAHARLGRRVARRRDLRVGPRRLRPHHQRVLRPDRVQSRALLLRGDRRVEAGRDRQAGARPRRGGDPRGRHARRRGRARA